MDKAQEYYQKSVDLKTKVYGEGSAETAPGLGLLGNVYSHKRELEKAKDIY